jgi:hypothetical protein
MPSPPDPPDPADGGDAAIPKTLPVNFVCVTPLFSDPHSGGLKKLAVVGSLAELGGWGLDGSLPLEQTRQEGARGGRAWERAEHAAEKEKGVRKWPQWHACAPDKKSNCARPLSWCRRNAPAPPCNVAPTHVGVSGVRR